MSILKEILILSANPKNTTRLRLDEEVREINEGVKRSKCRDQFMIYSRWATRIRDLRRAMLDHEPYIVHFCGHGEKNGIMVENDNGDATLVTPNALADLFALFKGQIECVVLSACYSGSQANAIVEHLNYVIGMSHQITDKAALEFTIGFYDALGAGKSIEEAFEFGRNAIQLYNLPEHIIPVLLRNAKLINDLVYKSSADNKIPLIKNTLRDSERCKIVHYQPTQIPTYFQDREDEGRQIIAFMHNEAQRVLTISGRGGVGKTVLACNAIKSLTNKSARNGATIDGVVYLNGINGRDITFPYLFSGLSRLLPIDDTEIMEQLYRSPAISIRQKVETLLDSLSSSFEKVLLLLDNFEAVMNCESRQINDRDLEEALIIVLDYHYHVLKVVITTRVSPTNFLLFKPERQQLLWLEGLKSPYAENIGSSTLALEICLAYFA